ncbi:MAG: hypothetical protein F6K28_13180 [Microcoleus sp. SIO2G3]|nr:hypothetical protein [Microcoleus sp. SIO2G3]
MHKRAEYNGILTNLDSLTQTQLQHWLDSQPAPQTKEESATQKRVRRLIRISKDEENE